MTERDRSAWQLAAGRRAIRRARPVGDGFVPRQLLCALVGIRRRQRKCPAVRGMSLSDELVLLLILVIGMTRVITR